MKMEHRYYLSTRRHYQTSDFEDSFYDSKLIYSLQHITFIGDISQENTMEALQKSLQTCYLAGINSKHHFKQIFVFDTSIGTLRLDWLMSRTGFNLMIIQIPSLNEKSAQWLWKLANNETA